MYKLIQTTPRLMAAALMAGLVGTSANADLVATDTARIDDDEREIVNVSLTVLAVTGQPRKIRHQCIPGTGQPIEQR